MNTKAKAPIGRFLDRKQAAVYIGLSDFWLERHCNDHEGPRWFRHGRKCWYRKTDLDAWLKDRREARGGVASVWRTSEARQLPEPPDRELENSYVEEWGQDEATTKRTAEDDLRNVLAKLNGEQLKAFAQMMIRLATEEKIGHA